MLNIKHAWPLIKQAKEIFSKEATIQVREQGLLAPRTSHSCCCCCVLYILQSTKRSPFLSPRISLGSRRKSAKHPPSLFHVRHADTPRTAW